MRGIYCVQGRVGWVRLSGGARNADWFRHRRGLLRMDRCVTPLLIAFVLTGEIELIVKILHGRCLSMEIYGFFCDVIYAVASGLRAVMNNRFYFIFPLSSPLSSLIFSHLLSSRTFHETEDQMTRSYQITDHIITYLSSIITLVSRKVKYQLPH